MLETTADAFNDSELPNWVPEAARNYIVHTEEGRSIRELAREAGCHASTVLRQVRKTEARRDDPLIDEALSGLGARHHSTGSPDTSKAKDSQTMNAMIRPPVPAPDQETVDREAKRILRRLCEPGACLAVAQDMEKAVVVRESGDAKTTRTAVVDRPVAQAMALKDWIACDAPGRISRYAITTAGRAALKRLLSEEDAMRRGFSEAATPFADQHRSWGEKECPEPESNRSRRVRYNLAESPILAMSRRKDKDGVPFLSADLVTAAERLREDFELAQMGPRVAQNWEKFLTGGGRGGFRGDSGIGNGPSGARDRVSAVLHDLGPGLGDVALRVCCFLEGLETAEKRMGWSARSGKVVLRIALQRLKRHYDDLGGSSLIG
ncbi:MAG: DUF6456 domain-containing protein [Paracoccaceae bacterium]